MEQKYLNLEKWIWKNYTQANIDIIKGGKKTPLGLGQQIIYVIHFHKVPWEKWILRLNLPFYFSSSKFFFINIIFYWQSGEMHPQNQMTNRAWRRSAILLPELGLSECKRLGIIGSAGGTACEYCMLPTFALMAIIRFRSPAVGGLLNCTSSSSPSLRAQLSAGGNSPSSSRPADWTNFMYLYSRLLVFFQK